MELFVDGADRRCEMGEAVREEGGRAAGADVGRGEESVG